MFGRQIVDCSRVNQWVETGQEGTILGVGDFERTLHGYALCKCVFLLLDPIRYSVVFDPAQSQIINFPKKYGTKRRCSTFYCD
jgi:hypothetical protein